MNARRQTSFHMKIAVLAMAFLFSLFSEISESASAPKTDGIMFDKKGNTLSASLSGADVADVATGLSKAAGVKVFLDENITQKVTSEFRNMPLEPGIKRLFGPGVSSAFVFVGDTDAAGKASYRLDTVRIFGSGNMTSARFKVFDGNAADVRKPEEAKTDTQPRIQERMPDTPGAIRHEIMAARKNLDIIRKKQEAESGAIKAEMGRIRMELGKNLSPDEREERIRKLSRHRQALARVRQANERIMANEEGNLRELIEAEAKVRDRRKFAARQRKSMHISGGQHVSGEKE